MSQAAEYEAAIVANVQSAAFQRATFAGPKRLQKASAIERVTLRMIELHGAPHLQISRFTARQDRTENVALSALPAALADVIALGFSNVHLVMTTEEIDLRLGKKLQLQMNRKRRDLQTPPALEPHNRIKNHPLPEGTADRLLQVMGIMTADGKIRPTMRAKFTQINEFLKLLDPLLEQIAAHPQSPGIAIPGLAPLSILDCGSGSAYLTLATHHYLTHGKKIPAHILGVDVNDELIQKSLARSHELGAHNLTFQNVPIARGTAALKPDIVLALHACDTATDDAIALGIRAHAKIILAVPCCHKNLNGQLHIEPLAPLHRHGILHQRFADLVTDTFRALILRLMGYKTDVIEFTATEHTARNLMIRAIKTHAPPDPAFANEYRRLRQFAAVTPCLETLLGPEFLAALNQP